ncbi:MAG: 2-oxo acid dehydrogenase subunit E2 [Actinomycetota bacterium]|nr:2-oxo acid dehydrogenase subunit E2 [Actinomycetota bacterium]
MSATEVISVEVPDIGDFDDVPVIEVLVGPGDAVGADDPLLTLESDKATMDVPAPFAGEIHELHVQVGDRVSQGTLLLTMAPGADGAAASRASAAASSGAPDESSAPDTVAGALAAEPPEPEREPEAAPAQGSRAAGPIHASPSARRLARERGVDITQVSGSGRGGRITRQDVEESGAGGPAPPAAAGPGLGLSLAPWPSIDYEKFGPVERTPRTRIQRISAPVLARNWVMIPHVTHNDEADITDLEAWRRQLNAEQEVKVTMVAFLVVACAAALKAFPDFNSSLDGEELVLKRYVNIGFAADTPQGLVVPVIRDADHMGLLEIAAELARLSARAREGKLGPADITGGTFSISSLGGIGGTSFTPIVNAPEVAILGATRAATKPVWDGAQFIPRLMLPLSLSYDHRVVDGAAAARFVTHLAGLLGDLRRALL